MFYIFILIIFLVALSVMGAVIFLSFYISKNLGYPNAGKIIGTLVSCFFAYCLISTIFADEFFSKNDAIELLEEQNIHLNDNFEIVENSSNWGDYSFTLSISEKDKNRIINEIKSAADYKDSSVQVTSLSHTQDERKAKVKYFQNYETSNGYVREYIKEYGGNYAPTFKQIYVDRVDNTLIFDNINP